MWNGLPTRRWALEVAIGAGVAGARSLSCMKHVGLNVAADPLFTAAYNGVNGGVVVVVADDIGCHSSQNEQDSRFYARSAGVPMLEPSTSQECKDFMKLAYELSEAYDEPVIVRYQHADLPFPRYCGTGGPQRGASSGI